MNIPAILAMLAIACTAITKPALAYIGPGLTVALLGYVSWPIAVLVGLFSILVFYPLRYLYRKLRAKKGTPPPPENNGGAHGGK